MTRPFFSGLVGAPFLRGLGVCCLILTVFSEATAVLVTWESGVSGNWDDPANWDIDPVTAGPQPGIPGPTDDVVIDVAEVVTVTHQSGTTLINSLTSTEAFSLTGGSLEVATTVQVSNTFTLNGGTLNNATVMPGTGGEGPVATFFTTSTLEGVVLNSDLSLEQGARLNLPNGLTLNGTATFLENGGNITTLEFPDAQTLGGTGEVVFASAGGGGRVWTASGTLTIGADMTIRGATGQVGNAGLPTVNLGTILADTSIRTITVTGSNVSNQGTLGAATSGTLSVFNLAADSGTISAESGGQVIVNGDYTQSAAGVISFGIGSPGINQFGRINFTGTVDLAGILKLLIVDNSFPEIGQSFQVMTAVSIVDNLSDSDGLVQGLVVFEPVFSNGTLTINTLWRDFTVTITREVISSGTEEQYTISYPVIAGEDYEVEFLDDLVGAGSWVALPGAPHNSGSVNDVVPFGSVGQRNYRVRIIGQ